MYVYKCKGKYLERNLLLLVYSLALLRASLAISHHGGWPQSEHIQERDHMARQEPRMRGGVSLVFYNTLRKTNSGCHKNYTDSLQG
jgi:hypothetical protein